MIRKVVQCDNCEKQHDIPEFGQIQISMPDGWLIVTKFSKEDHFQSELKHNHYCSNKCLLKHKSNPTDELIDKMSSAIYTKKPFASVETKENGVVIINE